MGIICSEGQAPTIRLHPHLRLNILAGEEAATRSSTGMQIMTEDVGKSQRINQKTKGVFAMKRKQKQCSNEKEPILKVQLTPRGFIFDGQGVSAIRAVSLIACIALIAIAVVAVVVLLTKSCQTENIENEKRTVYSSKPFPEKYLEETEINVFFDNRFIDP